MKIVNVTIKKFRSIHQIDFPASPLTLVCGPNSCGKSNVLRAIKFAFLRSFSADRMADNICHDVVAGNVVCHVTLKFDSPTPALAASLGIALDRQLIAPGPDLRWHVSARLDRRIPDFAHLCGLEGCELLLPTEPRLYPKREALAWRVGQLQ